MAHIHTRGRSRAQVPSKLRAVRYDDTAQRILANRIAFRLLIVAALVSAWVTWND